MKVCNFCGNRNFKEKNVQYIYKHDDQFLVVNNVPCEECEFCGEQYFKADVLKRIEKSFIEARGNTGYIKRDNRRRKA